MPFHCLIMTWWSKDWNRRRIKNRNIYKISKKLVFVKSKVGIFSLRVLRTDWLSHHRPSCREPLPAVSACPVLLWSSLQAHEYLPLWARAIDRSNRKLVWKRFVTTIRLDVAELNLDKILPVERCEKSTFRLLDETFYSPLKPEPLKFTCDELVACHHWLNLLSPVGADQRTATSFRWFESEKRFEVNILKSWR